jgi:glycosyltransferase involved in cell wall biosynthesis
MRFDQRPQRVLFVSTRIMGTDGVSLEIAKWTELLESLGVECRFLCGATDRPLDRSFLVPEANFKHPTIQEINSQCLGRKSRSRDMTGLILKTAEAIKYSIYAAFEQWRPEVVIVENALTLPINLPLGIALDQVLLETEIPCIAHHHDFAWERQRYTVNAVSDFIRAHFPPQRDELIHVVINHQAQQELSRRTGLSSIVIPNVMDFETHSEPDPERCSRFREAVGVREGDVLLLQPTRVVARKGIEHSIELAKALHDRNCKLVITHSNDDEGLQYFRHLDRLANYMGVEVFFAGDLVGSDSEHQNGKPFSVADAYHACDFVSFPSTYEGFGNAFLEAVYYRKLIFCNRYTIFRSEIEPLGFHVPMMDGFVDDDVIHQVRYYLDDKATYQEATEHNFELARKHFSYRQVLREIRRLLEPHAPWRRST